MCHVLTPLCSPDTMNWTCVVYGGPMVLVTIWWFISAHKWFKGPKVNIEHLMLGRDGNVVEGAEPKEGGDSEGELPEMGDGLLPELAQTGSIDKPVPRTELQ